MCEYVSHVSVLRIFISSFFFRSDMAVQNAIGDSFRGATWVALHNGGGVGWCVSSIWIFSWIKVPCFQFNGFSTFGKFGFEDLFVLKIRYSRRTVLLFWPPKNSHCYDLSFCMFYHILWYKYLCNTLQSFLDLFPNFVVLTIILLPIVTTDLNLIWHRVFCLGCVA